MVAFCVNPVGRELVLFRPVLTTWKDLQVFKAVQTANQLCLQRVNVINLPRLSAISREFLRQLVEGEQVL